MRKHVRYQLLRVVMILGPSAGHLVLWIVLLHCVDPCNPTRFLRMPYLFMIMFGSIVLLLLGVRCWIDVREIVREILHMDENEK